MADFALRLVFFAVAPIAIPPLIDRPQFVVRTSGHELSVLENHRWAEPLALDLTRAFVEALRRSPAGVDAAERDLARTRAAPLVLQVTISELVAGPGPSTSLQAAWVLRDRQKACVRTGHIGADIPTQPGYEAIPTAYAAAMSRLADAISASIAQGVACTDSARASSGGT